MNISCDVLVIEAVVEMKCCSCNEERRWKKGREELPRAPFIVKFLAYKPRDGNGAVAPESSKIEHWV